MKGVLDQDVRSISVKEIACEMAPAAAILMLPPALLAMYFLISADPQFARHPST